MVKGILFALAACFLWGLIFVIPDYIVGFDPFEIALGRHFIYGMLSCILLGITWKNLRIKHARKVWVKALKFSLIVNIFYYTSVVMGVRYASSSLTALILGLGPVCISIYGNWKEKECSFKQLFIPLLLIALGLILINYPAFQEKWEWEYLVGVIAAFIALIFWSWFVVANNSFLKLHREIELSTWSNIMGCSTFIWVLILGFSYESLGKVDHGARFFTASHELLTLIAGSLVLGVICSWLGFYLWNNACALLPVSLAGQITIFETVFGLIFAYTLRQEMPPLVEIFGVSLMLVAIVYGVNAFAIAKPEAEFNHESP